MKKLLFKIILLLSISTFGQIKAVIIDSESKEKIPFVNIWVENENIGTTSDNNGLFVLNDINKNKTIVFSAIGFVSKKIQSNSIKNTIELKPEITELQEIIITSKKKTQDFIIGSFEKSKINYYFSCGNNPWIVAKFFNFKSNYTNTPFLEKIKFVTKSNVNDSRFNVRLYGLNDKGEPDGYIYDKNIIGIARKGKQITEIDLSNLNIEFPKNGFFIAIEWLIIDTNRYKYKYTMKGSRKKLDGISYEPAIGTVPSETDENSWIFNQGKWSRIWKNSDLNKKSENNYNLLGIELTLTD